MTDQSWEERISAYVDGELSPAEREEVARAIDSDSDLKQLYDEWTRMRQVLQALPRVAPRPQLRESVRRVIEGESPARSRSRSVRWRSRAKWLGAAAALASAAVVLVMLIPNIGKETPEHASYEARAEPEHAPTFDASHDVETWEEEASVEEKMAAPAVAEADVAAGTLGGAALGGGDEHRDFRIERLLDELPEQGRLELVFTASEPVVRQLQETTRSRLGVVRKKADRPAKEEALAMEADAAPRRDSPPVADRAAPLKARRRVATAPAAPLAKPKAQGTGSLEPAETVLVLRGTRKELREQLAWLSRQPEVQWEKLGGPARLSGQHVPAAGMLKRGRGMGPGTVAGGGTGSEGLTEKPGAAEGAGGAGGARGGIMGGGGFSGGFGYGAPQAAPAERSLEKKRGTSPGDHAKKARSESGKKDKKVKGYFGMSNTMEPQNRTSDALVFPSESDERKDKLPARRVRIVLIIEPESGQ